MRYVNRPALVALALLLVGCATVAGPGPAATAQDGGIPDGFFQPEPDLPGTDASSALDLALCCVPADCNSGHESCFQ